MRTCTAEGCGKKHYAKGLCQRHYDSTPAKRAYGLTPESRARSSRFHHSPAGQIYAFTRRMKKFGITPEVYEQKLQAQANCCAICKLPENSRRRSRLSVDHDHSSGEVRDLLCARCNALIGFAMENKNILSEAITYLARWENAKP